MKSLIWAPRALSAGLIAVVAAFAIGEGAPHGLTGDETRQMAAMAAMAGGLVVAWFRPAIGGALALAGSVAFYGLNFAASGRLPGGPVFPLFPLAGFLFLLAGRSEREGGSDSGYRSPDSADTR
ncbi:MAG TPA: hypothetical protein VGM37_04750 [Armatimonadota bacterium]|jgi:hypothetical protein